MKAKPLAVLLVLLAALLPISLMAAPAAAPAKGSVAVQANLPLSFEPTGSPDLYLARSGRYAVSIGSRESSVAVTDPLTGASQLLRFGFKGANAAAILEPLDPLPGVTNYYLGSDPQHWRLGVKNFSKLRAPKVYPGVDVLYYGDQRRLEFDFLVAPAADPSPIRLTFAGMDKLYTTASGDLVVEVNGHAVTFARPDAYQRVAGKTKSVAVRYDLAGNGEVRLRLGKYDRSRELVIDPLLSYSTFLGGSQGDIATGIAVDSAGNAYVTGQTCSAAFAGASNPSGNCAAFVTKLNPAGTAVLYTTILNGNNTAIANAVAIDCQDNVYIAGKTNSNSGMPMVTNTYQGGDSDAFIAEIAATGSLTRTTYLGGSDADAAYGITVDNATPPNVIVVGQTASTNFPAYSGFQDKIEAYVAFVTKLDNKLDICTSGARYADAGTPPPGGTCYFSDFWGGQPPNVPGNPGVWLPNHQYLYGDIISVSYYNVITGLYTTYAEKCNAGGLSGSSVPNWGAASAAGAVTADGAVTWLNEGPPGLLVFAQTQANGVAVDPLGDVFVAGGSSSQFIACASCSYSNWLGAGAWVLKVSGSGERRYSTVLGATITDVGNGIAVDTQGQAYIVGTSTGGIFTTTGAYQSRIAGSQNAFLVQMNTLGSAIGYGTYLGGGAEQGLAVAVDINGAAYVTGSTKSYAFPTVNPLINPANNLPMSTLSAEQNAFVAKFIPGGTALAFSTYLGGANALDSDYGTAIAVHQNATADNDMYVAGVTNSPDFPVYPTTAPAAYQTTYGNNGDAFAAMILGKTIPNVAVAPGSLTFPSQTLSTPSAVQTIQVTNTGATLLQIATIQISGDFGATYTCGSTLAANSSCTISVTFTPTLVGTRTGSLIITDNGSDSPQTVQLTGTGTALTSGGGGTATPPSSSDFSLTGPTTPVSVAAGSNGTFTVSLAPVGGFNQTVVLTCAAPSPAGCSLSPSSITLDGSTTVPATATLSIPGGSGSGSSGPIWGALHHAMPWQTLPFCVMGVALIGRRKLWLPLLLIVLCLALVLAGCGGGGGSGANATSAAMQAGTYQVTVTATYTDPTGATAPITRTVNVTLQVTG